MPPELQKKIFEIFEKLKAYNEHNEWVDPRIVGASCNEAKDTLYMCVTLRSFSYFFVTGNCSIIDVFTNDDGSMTFQIVIRELR